jgi:hypothetical protein
MGRDVLLPQQHQGHPLALELLVDRRVVGRHVAHRRRPRRSQPREQRVLGQRQQHLRAELGHFGEAHVLGDDALGDLQSAGDLLVGQARFELQSVQLADAAHGECPGRHRPSGWQKPDRLRLQNTSPPAAVPDDRDRSFRHRDRPFRAATKPVTLDRNDRSRPAGTAGHDPSESAVTSRRNTHLPPCA